MLALRKGDTILYPTDTVWGIGCDATNEIAVSKIYNIKHRSESKSLILLVDSFELLNTYVPQISPAVKDLLLKVNNPTTVIYKNPVGLAKNVVASDNTVAIRIVQNNFCKQLIKAFGKPIVSTSANISGQPTPKSFKEIQKPILDSVNYIVNLQQNEVSEKSSTILKIVDSGEIIVLRN